MFNYKAQLIRVIDGDTIDVDIDLGFYITMRKRVRLAGIDAPEVRGPTREEGKAATVWLKGNIGSGWLAVATEKVADKYGRWVAWVWLIEDYDPALPRTAQTVNHKMVHEGHAIWRSYE